MSYTEVPVEKQPVFLVFSHVHYRSYTCTLRPVFAVSNSHGNTNDNDNTEL